MAQGFVDDIVAVIIRQKYIAYQMSSTLEFRAHNILFRLKAYNRLTSIFNNLITGGLFIENIL